MYEPDLIRMEWNDEGSWKIYSDGTRVHVAPPRTIHMSEWISVAERLPPAEEWVLLFWRRYPVDWIEIGQRVPDANESGPCDDWLDRTHHSFDSLPNFWMPLPEPPK